VHVSIGIGGTTVYWYCCTVVYEALGGRSKRSNSRCGAVQFRGTKRIYFRLIPAVYRRTRLVSLSSGRCILFSQGASDSVSNGQDPIIYRSRMHLHPLVAVLHNGVSFLLPSIGDGGGSGGGTRTCSADDSSTMSIWMNHQVWKPNFCTKYHRTPALANAWFVSFVGVFFVPVCRFIMLHIYCRKNGTYTDTFMRISINLDFLCATCNCYTGV
jgi:hypothetical protein